METPVTFQSHGTQIIGILHTPDDASTRRPAILFLHGFTATKCESHRLFVKAARALTKEGFVCLRFDFRGWGDSGGESEESGMSTMVEDTRAATDFLLAQSNVDLARLGYLGMSTGGAAAALAIGNDARVKSLALWNAVADGNQVARNIATVERMTSLGTKGKADYNGNWVGQRFVAEFLSMRPVAALEKRPVPALLVQAANDAQVHPSQVDLFQQALQKSGVRCEKLMVPAADHTFSSTVWESEVIGRTVKWFNEVL